MNKLQRDILLEIQAKKTTDQICNSLNITKSVFLNELRKISDAGIPLTIENNDVVRFKYPERNKAPLNINLDKEHIKIALLGDTHLASKYEDLESLNRAYDYIDDTGVDMVFHSGDLVDGLVSTPNYYRELKEETYTGQLEYAIDKYPKYSGKTMVVSGNHEDYWSILTGKEILSDVANKREDIEYLGSSRRIVNINGLRINVLHGKFIKENRVKNLYDYVNNIPIDKRPDIIHSGHKHYSNYKLYDGVEMFQNGSFMKLRPNLKGRGYKEDNTTYFVDVWFDDNGNVDRIAHQDKQFKKR